MDHDAADEALALALIGNLSRAALFSLFLSGGLDGYWPVAILGRPVSAMIGADSRTVRLSAATAAKQALRHPDLRVEDYALVQRILDEGELFHVGERFATGFLETDGRWWRAVFKATRDRAETYLVTLHRARPSNYRATKRRYETIGRGTEAPGGS